MAPLPPIAPYPSAEILKGLSADRWSTAIATYNDLLTHRLSLSSSDLLTDKALHSFIKSFFHESSLASSSSSTDPASKQLKQSTFRLLSRILTIPPPAKLPPDLLQGQFFLSVTVSLPRSLAVRNTFDLAWENHPEPLEISITNFKRTNIIPLFEQAGKKATPVTELQAILHKLSILFLQSPRIGEIFISGSDFLEELISLHRTTPSLQKPILRNIQVAFTGLLPVKNDEPINLKRKPNTSLLVDQLFLLKAHKPPDAEHAFLTSLVSETTLLHRLRSITPEQYENHTRLQSLIPNLEKYTPYGDGRVRRPLHLRKKAKGKGKAIIDRDGGIDENLVTDYVHQVREVFPELREQWVRKKVAQFGGDVESVIRGILDGTLYEEDLPSSVPTSPRVRRRSSIQAPHTPLNLTRRNIYDNDALDTLSANAVASLHIGKKGLEVPEHDSSVKDTIFAALAAFDSDDDERDDTYDIADVGGAVDTTESDPAPKPPTSTSIPTTSATTPDPNFNAEQILYEIWTTSSPAERAAIFARDSSTRRSPQRGDLKRKTGWTDEAIEGWGLMLERDIVGRRLKDLERRHGAGMRPGGGNLNTGGVERTRYRKVDEEDGDVEEEDGGGGGERGGRGGGYRGGGRGGAWGGGGGRDKRGGRGGRGGSRGGGSSESTGDSARDRARKGQNKSSRANHSRREGHAKKMARGMGGGPPP